MENLGVRKVMTPIKRLGLSRKRSPLVSKVDGNTLSPAASPNQLKTTPLRKSMLSMRMRDNVTPIKLRLASNASMSDSGSPSAVSLQESPKQLSPGIAVAKPDDGLERDIAMWKTGCKESLLALQSWILVNERLSVPIKTLAESLGVWSIIEMYFPGDSELMPVEKT